MRILIAVGRYPWPPRRGDQLRAVQVAELLSAEHEVTLLVPEPTAGQPAPPRHVPLRVERYRRGGAVRRLQGLVRATLEGHPFQSGLFAERDLSRRLRQLAPQADLVVLQLVRLAMHAGDVGTTPLIVDLIDSLGLNFRRRARLERPGIGLLFSLEAARLARGEARLVRRARRALVVSERDRQAVAAAVPELAQRLAVLPLAFPVDSRPRPHEPGEAPVLAVTGNLGYFPTTDGLRWLLSEVWPKLTARRREVRLVVAGSRAGRGLRRALAGAGAELIDAPADLAAVLGRATLALAPLRCGSGQPIKILEAWAAGVPVVATPWAAAGTTGVPGRDLAVAGGAAEWVEVILELLDDPPRRAALAEAGRRRVETDYAPEKIRRELLSLVIEAAGGGP